MLTCVAGPGLHPDTAAALAPLGAEVVDVSGCDSAYWDAIAARWDGGDDLLVVEQDIVPHAEVVPQLAACGRDWCAFPYAGPGGERLILGLGCTRFSAALQRKVPAADIEASGRLCQVDVPDGGGAWLGASRGMPWQWLDAIISARLWRGYGLRPCVHSPDVEHRHDYAEAACG